MGWYTEAIFDNSALMGLPFFLSEDITDLFVDRAEEEINPAVLEHLKLRYAGNFVRRREGEFSFELKDDELNIRLNSTALSRLTSRPELDLEHAGSGLKTINESLELILNNVKNPSQIWAMEQFDIARKAFKNGHYEDAIAYINNAIQGSSSQTGYRLDHRFHYLRGLILFGDMQQKTGELVDYQRAQQAFETAAEYALTSSDRSECLCKAGLSACATGHHKQAYKIFHQACEADPSDALAHYLYACLNFQRGSDEQGQDYLKLAFMLDLDMVGIALNDPSSRFFADDLEVVIEHVRQRHIDNVRPFMATAKYNWRKALKRISSEDNFEKVFEASHRHAFKVSKELSGIDLGKSSILEAGILAQYIDRDYNILTEELLRELSNDKEELAEDLEDFKDERYSLKRQRSPRIRSFGKIYKDIWKRSNKVTSSGIVIILVVLFVLLFVTALKLPQGGSSLGPFGRTTAALVGTLIVMFVLSFVIVPLWFIFRAIWTFIKSLIIGLFSVSLDKSGKAKFERATKEKLNAVDNEIDKVEADLKDAKRLRKDLMKILRPA